ncbi:hypothetical protein L211DRAFT_536066 [Terfezia boudieri ATCC MYA-4762]|uniref:Uncharacterized protein n=1 Tax=Terfezia boudieri ATCC MYA-4762 TaxID=1051890 RepID=A0A3N4LWS9_9PEZI|nr:hypothetical protein L211DRAFT_536066 [Terfezia boudieri ATCC MYA-4762]
MEPYRRSARRGGGCWLYTWLRSASIAHLLLFHLAAACCACVHSFSRDMPIGVCLCLIATVCTSRYVSHLSILYITNS